MQTVDELHVTNEMKWQNIIKVKYQQTVASQKTNIEESSEETN